MLSVSFAHGFPFADLPHVSAKVVVVTNNDRELAQRKAGEFGRRVYGLRKQIGFEAISLPMEAAFSRALSSARIPVVVADQSDNVGAGAPGDATYALRWLLDHEVHDAATAIVCDPEVVKKAKRAGTGARMPVRLGGKAGLSSGDPLDIDVVVLTVRENYMHARPQQSGDALLSPLGDTAALRCHGQIDVVVSSERCQCYGPDIFADHGIDWRGKRLLIPKSMQHFQAGFAPIAGELIYMAAPGAVPPDPRRIAYTRLDTSWLYPWCDDPLAHS